MRRIYTAAHLPQAYLLLHMLDAAGIRAKVFNENAQGGVGELPFTHTYPEIWLEHAGDEDRARALIVEFEQELRQPIGLVSCHRCTEDNPDTFDVCWNCGTVLGGE